MGDSNKCGLYVDDNPPWLVIVGRVYEESTNVHNIRLGNDQLKVGFEEVQDVDAHVPVPTQEVQLVGQTLNTFLAWPTHLVKLSSEQVFHVFLIIINKWSIINQVLIVIRLMFINSVE